ncbi:MAG: hypothetical protein AAF790_03495 [Planctomycetota bacterium]
MARAFAGTMGCLGMVVTLLRGVKEAAAVEATIASALTAMVVLAVVGGVLGAIAQATVDESVRVQLSKELAEAGVLPAATSEPTPATRGAA